MPRVYSVNGITTASGFGTNLKCLAQYVSGSTSSGWVQYVKCEGDQLSPASRIELVIARAHVKASGMTSKNPILLDPGGAAANGVGGTGATAVWVAGQTDPTLGDILWRKWVSTMSGAGVDIWFPDARYEFGAGGGVDVGAVVLYVNTAPASGTPILTFDLGITEVG